MLHADTVEQIKADTIVGTTALGQSRNPGSGDKNGLGDRLKCYSLKWVQTGTDLWSSEGI